MFIKFDDLDMLDFFEKEPVSIGEEGEAKFIYSIRDEKLFSMTMTIDTYMQKIDISINYNSSIIFAGQFEKILEIRKSEDILLVKMEEKKRLVIKKSPCLGVIVENE